ncbi:MAG: hypothetical protein KatS3mg105_2769 [Gemmatales bacterium]|nr:MAG: hypothetical protein KatS3mg105_2769 [Gemmatales bacterium]
MRRTLLLVSSTFLMLFLGGDAEACPFCGGQGPTLTGELKDASLVLFGTLKNPKQGAEFNGGSTDLQIEEVIKDHPILRDPKVVKMVDKKKVVTLPRYLPAVGKEGVRFVVFCSVFKDKIDPYRGLAVKGKSDLVKYLKGARELIDKPITERLLFAFEYLDNDDLEVANDAYREFANADYNDYRKIAAKFPADKIAGWLQDPDTPAFRFGLYGSLLGHCGTEKHAEILRKLLDSKRITSGLDGLMAGYTMLKPKEGWQYVLSVLNDPKREFIVRYNALRAARFFWNYRSDLVSQDEVVKGICLLLDQPDIADLAIEDLRKWNRWEVADKVLALFGKKSHDIPLLRRSILRYALSCQEKVPAAKQLVASLRQKDPEFVSDVEELLKLLQKE